MWLRGFATCSTQNPFRVACWPLAAEAVYMFVYIGVYTYAMLARLFFPPASIAFVGQCVRHFVGHIGVNSLYIHDKICYNINPNTKGVLEVENFVAVHTPMV